MSFFERGIQLLSIVILEHFYELWQRLFLFGLNWRFSLGPKWLNKKKAAQLEQPLLHKKNNSILDIFETD